MAKRPPWKRRGVLFSALVAGTLGGVGVAHAGVLGWWPCNEGRGDTIHDHGGIGGDGADFGAHWAGASFGGALLFDDGGEAVVVPDDPGLRVRDRVTLAARVNVGAPGTDWSCVVAKDGAYYLNLNAGHVEACVNTASGTCIARGATRLQSGRWYQIAMTYDRLFAGYPATIDEFTGMLPDPRANPAVPRGSADAGDWDQVMREIGNVIYDELDPDPARRYKLLYSGYTEPYAENNVYAGWAYSPDGFTWTKGGKVVSRALEDPYVVICDGTYYLFAEDKEDVPFRNMRRFHSADFVNWVDDGDTLDIQSGGWPPDWEAKDVSSPVVWIEDGVWYLLYEGRGGGYNGKIGLATSSDGLNWVRDPANPVVDAELGAWDSGNIVPDDIVKRSGVYYLIYHGYGYTEKSGFWCGIATSTDLHHWTRYAQNPFSNFDTVMYCRVPGATGADELALFAYDGYTGIVRYRPYVLSQPRVYIDAVEDGYWHRDDCANQRIAATSAPVYIGGIPAATHTLQGLLDDVYVFDDALQPPDLQAIMPPPPPPPTIGDLNCDGFVNNGDIDAFVLALTDAGAYQLAHPGCDLQHADINGDGFVNNGDIDAFVALLTGAPGAGAPGPGPH